MTVSISVIIDELAAKGWTVVDGAFEESLLLELEFEFDRKNEASLFREAKIGKESPLHKNSVRGDAVLWLDSTFLSAKNYLIEMNKVQESFNHELYLGLNRNEFHF